MTQTNITKNDLAFLTYMRALIEQIEREEETYTAQLNDWMSLATNSPTVPVPLGQGTIARAPILPPMPPQFPRRIERRDFNVMLAWARGENVLLHVLERE